MSKVVLKPGDILVCRNFERKGAQGLIKAFQNADWCQVNPALFIHGDQSIEVVSKERLRAIGYIHEDELKGNGTHEL